MKHELTSKPFVPDPEQMAAALDAAPDSANDPDCPYDAKDANAVAAFWAQGKVRLPGQRGPQKRPTKVAVSVRYNQEVLDFFKATGDGWQTRMNDVLQDYVEQQSAA